MERCILHNYAKFHENWSNYCWDMANYRFLRSWQSTISDLLDAYLGHPRGVLGKSFCCTKFSCNQCSCFDNILGIWLENAYSCSQNLFLGRHLTSKVGSNISETPKGTSLHESALFERSKTKIRRQVLTIGNFAKWHINNTHTHTTVLRLCGICPGKPGWAGTRRNIHPLLSS